MRVARSCLEKSRRLSRRLPAFSSTIITDDESPIPSLPPSPTNSLRLEFSFQQQDLSPLLQRSNAPGSCVSSAAMAERSERSQQRQQQTLCKSRKLKSTDEEAQLSSTIDVIIVHKWAILHPYSREFRGNSELSLKINY